MDRGERGVPRWRRGLWPTGGKGPPRASFLTHGGEIGAAMCGRMRLAGVWALRRGRASGATAPRGPTARHHSVAPSEDVGEEYHERDQNHGADHDDQPIGAHLRKYGLGSGRGGGRRGYHGAALRWASSIRCRGGNHRGLAVAPTFCAPYLPHLQRHIASGVTTRSVQNCTLRRVSGQFRGRAASLARWQQVCSARRLHPASGAKLDRNRSRSRLLRPLRPW